MIRKQDVLVLLAYYLGFSSIRNLAARLRHKSTARFLAFHDVLPRYVGQFRENLTFLKRHANVMSLDDFFFGKLPSNCLNVVITFDDGYKSWLTEVIPILKELGLPATFFISSGFVGLSREDGIAFARTRLCHAHEYEEHSGNLRLEEVRRIVEEGFSVGGHTLNHLNLGRMNDKTQLEYEITEDKKRLEDITGSAVRFFAYPSGVDYNSRIDLKKLLANAGYLGAVTTASGLNDRHTNPFLLRRELTAAMMPGNVFRARVFGNYDAIRFIRERLFKTFRQKRIPYRSPSDQLPADRRKYF